MMGCITDELRAYVGLSDGAVQRSIHAIADRIDAEYEKAIRELNNLADASMLLPVDADGKPWHVGDVIEWDDGITAEVIAIGGSTLYYTDEAGIVDWTQANSKRHHCELTVEDLLRELVYKWGESTDPDAYISEYAAKLQLADDAAEHMGGK